MILVAAPNLLSAQTVGPADAVEMTANGSINWTVGEVYAKGIGAPPARTGNPAQARAMAERAAFVVALRNLLETVKGVRVDSESVVENFMVKNDVIKTRVDGIVRGARILKTEYMSDGSVEVLVGINMKGALLNAVVPDNFGRVSSSTLPQRPSLIPQKPSDIKPARPVPPAVKPSQPSGSIDKKDEPARPEPLKPAPPSAPVPAPIKQAPVQPERKDHPVKGEQPLPTVASPSTVSFKGGVATGLIIDARGLGLRPALLPKIIDQQGQEVYVGQVVTRTNAVEQGVAGYAKDVNAAANNFRVTDNPAVIKALNASGPVKTDIMIGQIDAESLRQISSKGDFLQYCRVIIVY